MDIMKKMEEERKAQKRNEELDKVEKSGPVFALQWLRSAYHTQSKSADHILELLHELRGCYLSVVPGKLSVREGQLLNVCRICREPYGTSMPFILNYGEEFAHQSCLLINGIEDKPQ